MPQLQHDNSASPEVAVLMGSQSDWPTMHNTTNKLNELGIAYQVRVLSAHRHPKHVEAYVRQTEAKIFICAAGLAAHLGGVVASLTHKPVIAVPMKGGVMDGVDALLSMVQMPFGLPVATVAVGSHGARNAAVLALQILALNDSKHAATLAQFREQISDPGSGHPEA